MKVKCPNCCNCYHETTENFNPDVRPDGSMLRLIEPWRSWGWSPFGDEDGRELRFAESAITLCCDLCCPSCGSPLAPGGRLHLLEEPKEEEPEEVIVEKEPPKRRGRPPKEAQVNA